MSTINAIHAGFRQLGITEDEDKRGLYARVTGKPRLTLMSPAERDAVVTELRRLGFKPATKRPNGRAKLSGPYAGKLQALWIAAYNLGIVRDRDDAALEGFILRQTGIERERWLHHWDDARAVIEALKARMHRDAGVDWSSNRFIQDYMRKDGYRIARAQWSILSPKTPNDFWPVVTGLIGTGVLFRDLSDKNWITVMNYFGERIRQERRRPAGASI